MPTEPTILIICDDPGSDAAREAVARTESKLREEGRTDKVRAATPGMADAMRKSEPDAGYRYEPASVAALYDSPPPACEPRTYTNEPRNRAERRKAKRKRRK